MIDIVNAPTLIGARVIASHPPPQSTERLNRWYVHHRRDKTFGVATPSSTTCDRTTTISADGAVIAPYEKTSASDKNVLKRISTISAELQHAAVEPESRIRIGCFKIEVVPESQTCGTALEETKLWRIEPLVAYFAGIIDGDCIGR
ncbi:MAG: hypothetical protein WA905_14390 [Pseudolabrys sp.]